MKTSIQLEFPILIRGSERSGVSRGWSATSVTLFPTQIGCCSLSKNQNNGVRNKMSQNAIPKAIRFFAQITLKNSPRAQIQSGNPGYRVGSPMRPARPGHHHDQAHRHRIGIAKGLIQETAIDCLFKERRKYQGRKQEWPSSDSNGLSELRDFVVVSAPSQMVRKHEMLGASEEQNQRDADPYITGRSSVESEGPQICVEGLGSRKVAGRYHPNGEKEDPEDHISDRAVIRGRKLERNRLTDGRVNDLQTNEYPDTFPRILRSPLVIRPEQDWTFPGWYRYRSSH